MGEKIDKRSWTVAETTTRTYGQLVSRKLLRQEFGESCSRQQLYQFRDKYGWYPQFIARDPQYRMGEGIYRIPKDDEPLSNHGPKGAPDKVWRGLDSTQTDQDEAVPQVLEEPTLAAMEVIDRVTDHQEVEDGNLRRMRDLREQASILATVPSPLPSFVAFGDYEMVKAIIASRKFHPGYMPGPSGIGKTVMVRQACAELGREYIRVNITTETDEDDLIGGFRLRNGETVFDMGPVLVAMIRGAVLLIDEIDKASPKIMCLQPILEGEPITLKKIGITVTPADGFTVIATANTKGQGDDTGKFITSTIMDEAFLERFPVWVECGYPSIEIETEILTKTFEHAGGMLTKSSRAYCSTLARWAENIRAAAKEHAGEETMSTRRLCHIVRTFTVLGQGDKKNQAKALLLCLARFDDKTKRSFLDLYNKHVNDDGTPSNVGATPGAPKGW